MRSTCIRYLKFSELSQNFRFMISYCSAAIAWRKKSFRKYFDKEENLIKFHQLLARSMEAPTESMASFIQDEIIV